MFGFFKKTRWFDAEAETVLLGVPKMFKIYVDFGAYHLPFRDENGMVMVDAFEKGAKGIILQFQEDGMENYFPFTQPIEGIYVDRLRVWVEKVVNLYRKTNVSTPENVLYDSQRKLRDAIQNTILVQGYQKPDEKDVSIYTNSLSVAGRERLCNLIRNLDTNSVDVLLTIKVSGSTQEQIDSTLNELAMYDALN